jgi:Secretion system C-terminal sorting domain
VHSGVWQYRLGRDVVWFGNFEDEGCSLWNINDESYDTTVFLGGKRSLLQERPAGSGSITTGMEKRILCESSTSRYSLYGYFKTLNAANATMNVRFYSSRTGTEIGSSEIGAQIAGTSNWTFYHHEFVPASGTMFFDVSLSSSSPASGVGKTWFDDVGIIAWSDWKAINPSEILDTPNDIYWLQLKSGVQTSIARVSYNVTSYMQSSTPVKRSISSRPTSFELYQNYPNPFNPTTSIRYAISTPGHVTLKVFDVLGREVASLVNQEKPLGTYEAMWTPTNVSSGVYFCRLNAGAVVLQRKMLLLK